MKLPDRRFGFDEIRFVQLSHDKIAAVLDGEFWSDFIRLPIKFIGKPWNATEEQVEGTGATACHTSLREICQVYVPGERDSISTQKEVIRAY